MSETVDTLAAVDRLRSNVRERVHSGAWFPALAIAGFILLSTVLYAYPFGDPQSWVEVPFWAGLPHQEQNPTLSYLFWFLGLPALLALIAYWYRRRELQSGLRMPWQRFTWIALGPLVTIGLLAAVPTRRFGEYDTIVAIDITWQTWLNALLTPLVAVAIAVMALGWVERSRWLAFAGFWIGLIAVWQGVFGMGGIPGWLSYVLSGFEGPALGGNVELLGVHRPGPLLIVITLPLIVFGLVRLRKASR